MTKYLNTLLLIIISTIIAGCEGIPFLKEPGMLLSKEESGPTMAPAPLPDYQVGEYFVYDDNTTEYVTARRDNQVEWKNNRGVSRIALTNPFIPDISWKTDSKVSKSSISAKDDMLWPLRVGNSGTVDIDQTIYQLPSYQQTNLVRKWNCLVDGSRTITVKAGRFDTYIITCKRYSQTSGKLRATRRYFYSPEIGHYVLRENEYTSRRGKTKQLVAYGFDSTYLSEVDQRSLNTILQKTLSQKPDGSASMWNSTSGRISAMLIPVRSYKGSSNQQCREYHSVYNLSGSIRKNVRQVCKDSESRLWRRVDSIAAN